MNPRTQRQRPHGSRGQTLIEVGFILIVLGLIAAAIAVSVIPMLAAARKDRAAADLQNLEWTFRYCQKRHGHVPDVDAGLAALVTEGCLDAPLQDPWHHDYVYRVEGGVRVILSYGADGEPGGTGHDADITRQLPPLDFRSLDGKVSPAPTPPSLPAPGP